MAEKRKRGANFSDVETATAVRLLEDFKRVLEEKGHDNNNKKKARVWEHLTLKFNLEASVTRKTSKQLIHLWRDLKGKAKKVALQRARPGTGRGTHLLPPAPPFQWQLLQVPRNIPRKSSSISRGCRTPTEAVAGTDRESADS